MNNVKRDPKAAGELFKKNCDEHDHPRSCHNYGRYVVLNGRDPDRARNFDNVSFIALLVMNKIVINSNI